MRILFLTHYSFLYGSNRSLASLINHYILQGEHVEVMLPSRGAFYHYLVKRGVKVHHFMFLYEVLYYKLNTKYLSLPLLWLYDILMLPLLCYKIYKIKPDIIYTNSTADLISVWIAKFLKRKHIVHVREFMEEDFGARCIFGKIAKRNIILKSDGVICVSNAVAKSVIGTLPSNVKVIYNGLPHPQNDYTYPDLTKSLKIGVVGNIDISKQQDLAISYMPILLQYYPYAELHIIGDKDCPYKKKIKQQVQDLNLDKKVIFDGFVKYVEDIYEKFDVLLMCSRSEAFGRVTVEAMLRKKPVIGYDAGGTTELINNGETGFIFKNVDDVVSALDIIVNEKRKMHTIVDKALNFANEIFSESNYVKQNYEFVNNLFNGQKA